jgi:hypothetical protein
MDFGTRPARRSSISRTGEAEIDCDRLRFLKKIGEAGELLDSGSQKY